jgi:hypothetical protein
MSWPILACGLTGVFACDLTKGDREELDDILNGGIQAVRTVLRALALRHLHDGKAAGCRQKAAIVSSSTEPSSFPMRLPGRRQ